MYVWPWHFTIWDYLLLSYFIVHQRVATLDRICQWLPNCFQYIKLTHNLCSAFFCSFTCESVGEQYLSSSNYMDSISLSGSNGCSLSSSLKGTDLPELFSKLGLGKYTDIFQQQEVINEQSYWCKNLPCLSVCSFVLSAYLCVCSLLDWPANVCHIDGSRSEGAGNHDIRCSQENVTGHLRSVISLDREKG